MLFRSGCALARSLLLSRELPCRKVPFLPERFRSSQKKAHMGTGMCRDEKAAAAETAGTEGAPEGWGEWGSWGQLEPEWARQERAPGRVEILQETRKRERGPRDHGDGTVSQDRWEQEHVGGDGTGGGWSRVGRQSGQLGPGEEAMVGGWRSAQRDGWCRGRGVWRLMDGEGQCGTAW